MIGPFDAILGDLDFQLGRNLKKVDYSIGFGPQSEGRNTAEGT